MQTFPGMSLSLPAAGRAIVLRIKPPEASCPYGLPSLTSPRLPALRAALALVRWPVRAAPNAAGGARRAAAVRGHRSGGPLFRLP